MSLFLFFFIILWLYQFLEWNNTTIKEPTVKTYYTFDKNILDMTKQQELAEITSTIIEKANDTIQDVDYIEITWSVHQIGEEMILAPNVKIQYSL